MTIVISVTSSSSAAPFTAEQTEEIVQGYMSIDLGRVSALSTSIEPQQIATRDDENRWVVNTGWLEMTKPVDATGFAVYNRFLPGPTMTIKVCVCV